MRPVTIFIVLSVLFIANLGATAVPEPNYAGSELKFKTISDKPTEWKVPLDTTGRKPKLYVDDPGGPIKPTHVARVSLHKDYPRSTSEHDTLDKIHDSPIFKKFSKSQQEFLRTEFAVRVDSDSNPEKPYHYYSTWLYTVSEEDAKLMAQAYLDGLNRFIDQRVAEYKHELSKSQQRLDLAQKELPEKETKLKACEEQYKAVKDNTHRFSSDNEASELAKKTILEMDKTLDTLEIELAGIREKLNTIEKYRNKPNQRDAILARLDEMFVEQMIELSGLEARRQTTERLLAIQQRFLSLFNERKEQRSTVSRLKENIDDSKSRISYINNLLSNPRPNILPPKVYQNKVTIYPVLTE